MFYLTYISTSDSFRNVASTDNAFRKSKFVQSRVDQETYQYPVYNCIYDSVKFQPAQGVGHS